MPRRSLPRVLALFVVASVTACGGGDDAEEGGTADRAADQADAQAYVDAAVASLTADGVFDQETAACISTALVDLVGADALARAEVSPEEFAEAETFDVLAVDMPEQADGRLVSSLADCDIAGNLMSTFVAELGVELADDAVACLDQSVDRQAVAEAFAGALFAPAGEAPDDGAADSQDGAEAAMVDAFVACPGAVAAVFLAEGPGPVPPQAEACVSGLVEARPDLVRAAIAGDEAAAADLGTQIGTTCPAAVSG